MALPPKVLVAEQETRAMPRKGQRIRSVLPVRAYGTDKNGKPFTTIAHTLDVSATGARIAGLGHALNVGDIIGLQKGTDKARYRVVWVGAAEHGTEGQLGVSCLQAGKSIWGLHFENEADGWQDPKAEEAKKSAPGWTIGQPERRRAQRYPCNIGAELLVEGSSLMLWGRCTDLSSGGCYIETRSPLPAETKIEVRLRTEVAPLHVESVVKTTHAFLGMGMQFVSLSEQDAKTLGRLLMVLARNNSGEAGAARITDSSVAARRAALQKLSTSLDQLRESAGANLDDPAMLAAVRRGLEQVGNLLLSFQRTVCGPNQAGDRKETSVVLSQHRMQTATAMLNEIADNFTAADSALPEASRLMTAVDEVQVRLAGPRRELAKMEAAPPSSLTEVIQFPAAKNTGA